MEHLGEAVKFFREQKRLTMGQLAQKSRLSVSTISALEGGKRGKKRPPYTTVERLAKALDMGPEELIGWRPDGRLRVVEKNWGSLSDEAKDRIADIALRDAARSEAGLGAETVGAHERD